jgi:pimeloyl-ACP methyl ester carboxylesterase
MNRFLVSVPLFVGLIGLSACSSEEAIPTDIKVDPIEWSTCDEFPEQENLECGSLAVPLNYADVEGEKIEISLVRIPAASKKSKGVVLSNPGGPGSSGVEFVQYWSAELLENIGLEDFDVVGFDPRGVGRSGALSCLSDQKNDAFVYLDYTPDDDREQTLYDEWLAIEEPCTEKYGDALRFYSTENTARDMDLIRQSMEYEKINFLGISYGTYLGGVYATLFPDRVESMFLDSAYDPQGDTAEQDYLTQAEGFENAFDNWVDWCESTSDECSFSSDDVKADWLELYDSSDLKSVFTDDEREVNGVVIETATTAVLYSRAEWPYLADALSALRDGDAAQILEIADQYTGRAEDGTYGGGYDSFSTIRCASGITDGEAKDPDALLKKIQEVAPWYGREYDVDSFGGGYCESVFDRSKMFDIDYQGDAPIVVLGGTDDPATPLRWAEEMATQLGSNATLLTFNGEGHSQIFVSRCVDAIAKKLFLSGRTPNKGTECDADVPIAKPDWWDAVVSLEGGDIDQDMMSYYFSADPIDAYAEYFEIEGSAEEVFAEVKAAFEKRGWVYEEGESPDSVVDAQWFVDPDDDAVYVGVLLSSPEELEKYEMVVPDGIVQPGSSVVQVYYWP